MRSTETLDQLKSGQLVGQKKLKLACQLREFPPEILDLADSLEMLDLSGNHLSTLPDNFNQLKKLKIAFFNNNVFETFPAILAQCPALSMISFKGNRISVIGEKVLSPAIRWLILTHNNLESLPADIGQLKNLQKCMLAGNQLQSLPEEMSACKNLQLIRLSANRLQTLPSWLLSLPKLSWLAYAGNPLCNQAITNLNGGAESDGAESSERPLSTINPADLQRGEILGQGASGIIYKGLWTPSIAVKTEIRQILPGASLEVAIKIFKGEITSDGLPSDEMKACIASGIHPNLVTVLGKLGHSSQLPKEAGLVFSYISPDYTNLGGPPSLETCTRDTYSAETTFTLPTILHLTRGISSAIAHLHQKGIMHGDLYAHNILINPDGKSFLGDFGAASLYDLNDSAMSKSLQRLEVRAFGCLLEELLDRCYTLENKANLSTAASLLRQLQQACLQQNPDLRPLFLEISERLATIENSLGNEN